jgi:voltage-gated potassium channel
MSPVRKIALLVLLMLLIMVGGTVGYMVIEGASLLDAVYMTIITLSSVGYEETIPLSHAGRVFTIILISFGAGTVAFMVFMIGGIVVEGQIRKVFGRRFVERQIKGLKDHYIICGFGRMGSVLAGQLAEQKVPLVVVEQDSEAVARLADSDFLFVEGDATTEDVLESANIRNARGLISGLTSDADNLFVTLTARGMNPDLFIMARAVDERSEGKLLLAGADRVVDPYRLGAMRLAQSILRPAFVDFVELATHRDHLELGMEEIRVEPGSPLDGVRLRDSEIRSRYGLMVITIKKTDGTMTLNPPPDLMIEAGDILISIGKPEDLRQLDDVCSGVGE